MLLFPPLPCNRPDDGADCDSGEWTGEKRRRHLGPSLPSGTGEVADARISSSSSDASEERVPDGPDLEDPIINDEVLEYDEEEFMECVQFLSKRRQILVSRRVLGLEIQRELYKDLVHWRNKAHEVVHRWFHLSPIHSACILCVPIVSITYYTILLLLPASICMSFCTFAFKHMFP